MNVESLVGITLGTCTLEKLIGQGGMGAVFLAQQSRPRRQVAVKVLLLGTRLTPKQRTAFLERFRRETDAAASLEHPNILPVHEYGEQNGLAYLVMPYVSGGTLRDELEREASRGNNGQLTFAKAVDYLDQLAAALDFAHERGVIHRDVKPANVLMTPEGRLLLTDFGLVKVVAEGQEPQSSITGAGVPLGTPDYMAPEQVVGGEIDGRADIYALGVVLYQMITGKLPFTGDMPMQIAMQQLHSGPPLPHTLRADLPITAEQVLLRVLAKRPAERYMAAQDFASAFRLALAVSGIQLAPQVVGGSGPLAPGSETRFFTPRGLFDPSWQPGMVSAVHEGQVQSYQQSSVDTLSPVLGPSGPSTTTGLQGRKRPFGATPSFVPISASATSAPQSGASIAPAFPSIPSTPVTPAAPVTPAPVQPSASSPRKTVALSPLSPLPTTGNLSPSTVPTANNTTAGNGVASATGALPPLANGASATTTMKLTQSFKVVQVPVAGQPGQYMTGLLPMLSSGLETEQERSEAGSTSEAASQRKLPSLPSWVSSLPYGTAINRRYSDLQKQVKLVLFVTVALLLLLSTGTFLLIRSHVSQRTGTQSQMSSALRVAAIANAQATATAEANVIIVDSLSDNTHNWPVATTGSQLFIFKDNAYHIFNNDPRKYSAIALLPGESLNGSFVYTLTMHEVRGDDTSVNNQFGLIFRFNVHQQDGKTYKSFYIFEVSNSPGGNYELLKYDDSNTSGNGPWSTVWSSKYGSEFHSGHDANSVNTFKVIADGSNFTLVVNGKQVGKAHDSSLSSGQIGMLVNQMGTEVAFSNLLLTHK